MGLTLTHLGLVCALGINADEITKNAMQGVAPGMVSVSDDIPGQTAHFFEVLDKTPAFMRCYRLIDMAVHQIRKAIDHLKSQYDHTKLGIVLGASNTGVHEAQHELTRWIREGVYPTEFKLEKIELGSPALYLQKQVGFFGPAYVISTACSSSAKAFASAKHLIDSGVCEAVLVGGVDARCSFAHQGFFGLSALSLKRTNPFSINRDGINLGEGAALFIMTKGDEGIRLLGVGESSDGYDLTSPDPTGKGAFIAMKQALDEAGISPGEIDYINMHGTGTAANDAMEGKAIYDLFGDHVLCASTKSLTGHALGASGAIEAGLSWLMLNRNCVIPHYFDGVFDSSIPRIKLAKNTDNRPIKTIMSNSFAFGGSNASIIFGVR